MRRLGFALLLLVPFVGLAQPVYRWIDSEGVVHYTDDPRKLPPGVKAERTEGAPIGEVTISGPEPAPAVEPAPAPPPAEADERIAEREWRARFRAIHDRIRSLEDAIAADRKKLRDIDSGLPVAGTYVCPQRVYGLPSGVYTGGFPCFPSAIDPEYQLTKDRLAANETALARAKEDLQELERQASFAAVPREWRR